MYLYIYIHTCVIMCVCNFSPNYCHIFVYTYTLSPNWPHFWLVWPYPSSQAKAKKMVAMVPASGQPLVRLRTKTSSDSLTSDAPTDAYTTPPRQTSGVSTPTSKTDSNRDQFLGLSISYWLSFGSKWHLLDLPVYSINHGVCLRLQRSFSTVSAPWPKWFHAQCFNRLHLESKLFIVANMTRMGKVLQWRLGFPVISSHSQQPLMYLPRSWSKSSRWAQMAASFVYLGGANAGSPTMPQRPHHPHITQGLWPTYSWGIPNEWGGESQDSRYEQRWYPNWGTSWLIQPHGEEV